MTERIQSVDRAIDLLLAVAAAGPADAGVPALARACGLNRATAWRLLKTLQARGMVTVDGRAAGTHSGVTAVELGGRRGAGRPDRGGAPGAGAHVRADRRDGVAGDARRRRAHLRRRGHADRRADGELAGPHRAAARHVDRARRCSRSCPPARCGGCSPTTLPAFTDTTITTPEALDAELAATRARGYGTCAGELESSLYGVSAPVLDRAGRPLAVLSIWGPKDRVPEQTVRRAGPDRRRGRPGGRACGRPRRRRWWRRLTPSTSAQRPAAAGPGHGCGPAARAARPGRRPGRR